MIYDLADAEQRQAFDAEQARQSLVYGNTYALVLGRSRVLLIEPWNYQAVTR